MAEVYCLFREMELCSIFTTRDKAIAALRWEHEWFHDNGDEACKGCKDHLSYQLFTYSIVVMPMDLPNDAEPYVPLTILTLCGGAVIVYKAHMGRNDRFEGTLTEFRAAKYTYDGPDGMFPSQDLLGIDKGALFFEHIEIMP